MNQTLKKKTLSQFKGNWLAAILIALPYFLIYVLALIMPKQGTALISILAIFTSIGMFYTYLNWFRSGNVPASPFQTSVKNIFSTPNSFGPFLVSLLASIMAGLWTLLLVVPGIIKILAYSQAIFIYKDEVAAGNESPRPIDCITKSREMMNGHKAELFMLDLSFIGWAILSIFTAGIGLIWYLPYYSGTMVNYYEQLKNN